MSREFTAEPSACAGVSTTMKEHMTLAPTTTLGLEEINLGSLDFWLRNDVDGALAKLRKECPVAWHQHPDSGKGFWSLTRYADIEAATANYQTFSNASGVQIINDNLGTLKPSDVSILISDPPAQTRRRSLVSRSFTARTVAKIEVSVRRRAEAIVEAIAPKE